MVAVVRALTRPDLGPLVALLIVTAVFAIADQLWGRGFFATTINLKLILQTAAIVAVPALGMTVIIIAGGIDDEIGRIDQLVSADVYCAEINAVEARAALIIDQP